MCWMFKFCLTATFVPFNHHHHHQTINNSMHHHWHTTVLYLAHLIIPHRKLHTNGNLKVTQKPKYCTRSWTLLLKSLSLYVIETITHTGKPRQCSNKRPRWHTTSGNWYARMYAEKWRKGFRTPKNSYNDVKPRTEFLSRAPYLVHLLSSTITDFLSNCHPGLPLSHKKTLLS